MIPAELPSGGRPGEGEQTEQHSLILRGLEEGSLHLDHGGGTAGQSVRSLGSQSGWICTPHRSWLNIGSVVTVVIVEGLG